jgi:glutathione S-transferase
LALAAAGLRPGVDLEVREVNLRRKPPELLQASPKGTVPTLVVPQAEAMGQAWDPAVGPGTTAV